MRLDRQRSSRRQDLEQERQRAELRRDLVAQRSDGICRDHLIERAAVALDHAGRTGMGAHPQLGLGCATGGTSLQTGEERRVAPVVVTDRTDQSSDHGAVSIRATPLRRSEDPPVGAVGRSTEQTTGTASALGNASATMTLSVPRATW